MGKLINDYMGNDKWFDIIKTFGPDINDFKLTDENYYSTEANILYMSVSQYKDFVGTWGIPGCEERALAKIRGTYIEEPSMPMLIGSYIDAYFEGTLSEFRRNNKQIFKKDGKTLLAQFKHAEKIIKVAENDDFFMSFLSGDKQLIFTGELFGVQWKIKVDSFHWFKCIVDLKVMKSLTELKYVKDFGKMEFFRYWGYDIQGAVYQAVIEASTGMHLPFIIAGLSKEEAPDHRIIGVDESTLKEAYFGIEDKLPRVIRIKNGEEKPTRCEECEYCRATRKLDSVMNYAMFMGAD